ncbi:hypothetical protein Moror_1644 [Moniliophthora roreri MCA 2997]|uniref:Uncharacterized protein n=1 Tax=Moniliophthora roreri (strain MCA 2997) TaxID=1381753 RepID=V2XM06_MONRO|nr:hypothetical protein Moror_1644 [Moniliophthora roreri MCA 2997]
MSVPSGYLNVDTCRKKGRAIELVLGKLRALVGYAAKSEDWTCWGQTEPNVVRTTQRVMVFDSGPAFADIVVGLTHLTIKSCIGEERGFGHRDGMTGSDQQIYEYYTARSHQTKRKTRTSAVVYRRF